MTRSLLARSAGPLAIVAGALVVVTRVVIMVTTPADLDSLTVFVLSTTHAINGVASIVAYPGSVILGLAFVALGVWWLRSGRSAVEARGDPVELGQ